MNISCVVCKFSFEITLVTHFQILIHWLNQIYFISREKKHEDVFMSEPFYREEWNEVTSSNISLLMMSCNPYIYIYIYILTVYEKNLNFISHSIFRNVIQCMHSLS
jgi:hypothetical protein